MHCIATAVAVAIVLLAIVVVVADDELETCSIHYCGGFSYFDIPRYYDGLFKTDHDVVTDELKWVADHEKRYGNMWEFWEQMFDHELSGATSGDYDQCCPTTHSHINPSTMTNINGDLRSIIHLNQLNPPQYQWIPQNGCASAPNFCHGICRIENITLYLLVADFTNSPPFKFDSFYVPGYCSCKSS